jgi:hypothetical protein
MVMKLGLEVEGRLRGLPTLFLGAAYVEKAVAFLKHLSENNQQAPGHVYISDNDNILDYVDVSDLFPTKLVTLDVTEIQYDSPLDIPENIVIMLRLKGSDHDIFENVVRLRSTDMIKIEHERNVFCFTVGSAMLTEPHEFDDDVEVQW